MSTSEEALLLAPLLELSHALAASDIRSALPRVLEILADAFGALNGAILLADEEGTSLRIEACLLYTSPSPRDS